MGGVVGLGVEGADPASDCESGDGEPDTEPAENKKHSIDILLWQVAGVKTNYFACSK